MIQIRLLSGTVHLRQAMPNLVTDTGILMVEKYMDDRKQFIILGVGPAKPLKNGCIPDLEFKPGQMCLIPHLQDAQWLDDGTIIAKANQIEAVWDNE